MWKHRTVSVAHGGDAGSQPHADGDVAGVHDGAVGGVDGEAVGDARRVAYGLDGDDLGAVPHVGVDAGGRPLQIVLELVPGGEERLVVDEVDEPAPVVQVGEEGVGARGVAEGDQVLREGDLHGGALEEHSGMPGEGGLPVEEPGPHGVVRGVGIVLFDGDRQCEIGGSESDPDEVEEFRWFAVRRRRVTAVVAGAVGHGRSSVLGGRSRGWIDRTRR